MKFSYSFFSGLMLLLFVFNLNANEVKSIHEIELLKHKNDSPLIAKQKYNSQKDKSPSTKSLNPAYKVMGYLPYWVNSTDEIRWDLLSSIVWFSCGVNSSGTLGNCHNWPDAAPIAEAKAHNVKILLGFTLFGSDDLKTLLNSSTNRTTLVSNIITKVKAGPADGVNLDFEGLPSAASDGYVSLVKELHQALIDNNLVVNISMAIPAVDWSGSWQLNTLADYSEAFFIMGYDYHYSGGNPGPLAPLISNPPWSNGSGISIEKTVRTYVKLLENNRHKLLLGVPYYGIDWPVLDYDTVPGTKIDKGKSHTYAINKNMESQYSRRLDQSSMTPWMGYNNGTDHQNFYEDEESLEAKYRMLLFSDIGGVGIWALNYDKGYNQLWDLLEKYFVPDTVAPVEGSSAETAIELQFPLDYADNTARYASDIVDSWACAPDISECGPEIWLKINAGYGGHVSLSIEESEGVDVDLNLLDNSSPSSCLKRANTVIENDLSAGVHYLVIDSYCASNGRASSGAFTLTGSFVPVIPDGDISDGDILDNDTTEKDITDVETDTEVTDGDLDMDLITDIEADTEITDDDFDTDLITDIEADTEITDSDLDTDLIADIEADREVTDGDLDTDLIRDIDKKIEVDGELCNDNENSNSQVVYRGSGGCSQTDSQSFDFLFIIAFIAVFTLRKRPNTCL